MKQLVFLVCTILCGQTLVLAHQGSLTYVANEAVLITNGDQKVLFDPFFHQSFGTYQLVPEDIKQDIFSGNPPFDNVTAIVISHAHADHFATNDVLKYLQQHPTTLLVAPEQAVIELSALPEASQIQPQVTSIKLAFKQPPKSFELAGLIIDAVRIPHAGWPSRADVENLVYRVTLNLDPTVKPREITATTGALDYGKKVIFTNKVTPNFIPTPITPVATTLPTSSTTESRLKEPSSSITVMHLGDADPDDDHYLLYQEHWQKRVSDTALPPYWFYFSAEGRDILNNILNVRKTIGIHVPIEVPKRLKSSGQDYFSKPGETRMINEPHTH